MATSAGNKFVANVLLFIVGTTILSALSLITAGLYFVFDETLAEITNLPQLATLGFWQVWAFLSGWTEAK
jgi:hypothetical protein